MAWPELHQEQRLKHEGHEEQEGKDRTFFASFVSFVLKAFALAFTSTFMACDPPALRRRLVRSASRLGSCAGPERVVRPRSPARTRRASCRGRSALRRCRSAGNPCGTDDRRNRSP